MNNVSLLKKGVGVLMPLGSGIGQGIDSIDGFYPDGSRVETFNLDGKVIEFWHKESH